MRAAWASRAVLVGRQRGAGERRGGGQRELRARDPVAEPRGTARATSVARPLVREPTTWIAVGSAGLDRGREALRDDERRVGIAGLDRGPGRRLGRDAGDVRDAGGRERPDHVVAQHERQLAAIHVGHHPGRVEGGAGADEPAEDEREPERGDDREDQRRPVAEPLAEVLGGDQ